MDKMEITTKDKLEEIYEWFNNGDLYLINFEKYNIVDHEINRVYNFKIHGVDFEPQTNFELYICAEANMDYGDDGKSYYYLNKIIDSDDSSFKGEAYALLSYQHLYGTQFLKSDPNKGIQHCDKSIELGCSLAAKIMADYYSNVNSENMILEAINFYKKAIELGYRNKEDIVEAIIDRYEELEDQYGIIMFANEYYKEGLPDILDDYLGEAVPSDIPNDVLDIIKNLDPEIVQKKGVSDLIKLVHICLNHSNNSNNFADPYEIII